MLILNPVTVCPKITASFDPEIVTDVDQFEIEWRRIHLEEWNESCQESLVTFWTEVAKSTNSEGEQNFPATTKVAFALLSLPFFNATV